MTPMSSTVKLADLRFHLDQTELHSHLGQLLFTERTLWVMVQTSLQTLKTERVTTRRRHWLIEKSEQGSKGKKKNKHIKQHTVYDKDKHHIWAETRECYILQVTYLATT